MSFAFKKAGVWAHIFQCHHSLYFYRTNIIDQINQSFCQSQKPFDSRSAHLTLTTKISISVLLTALLGRFVSCFSFHSADGQCYLKAQEWQRPVLYHTHLWLGEPPSHIQVQTHRDIAPGFFIAPCLLSKMWGSKSGYNTAQLTLV